MRSLAILLTFSFFGLSIGAQATEEVTSAPPPVPKMIYKKSEAHQFSGSKLKGQLKKPELSYIYRRRGLRAEKIINIPENFDEEIKNGAGQF